MLSIMRTTRQGGKRAVERFRQTLALQPDFASDEAVRDTVRKILADVRQRGDRAVSACTRKFDGADVPAERLRVSPAEIEQARAKTPKDLIAAAIRARDNIRQFQSTILHRDPKPVVGKGKRLGLRYVPIASVGVCVPGAAAPLPSSLLMTAVPAQVAGVERIAVVSPPRFGGDIGPTILAVCSILGIEEVYRVGGAQAVAALAFGTESVQAVDKIVGPGNEYVQTAKREVAGAVGIDMFAGSSEVLILADDSAPLAYIAADMLAQAEHGPGGAVLVTDSETLAEEVNGELDRQLSCLKRKKEVAEGLENRSAIIVVAGRAEAVQLANDFAPEHLEVMLREAEKVLPALRNAGTIFVGPLATVALGDYIAGPSHTLPTGGTARFASGLSANDFLKAVSIVQYDGEGLAGDAPDAMRLAEAEGLDAHARSIGIRIEKQGS
ncbi:MAG: histidinol dehydrogenase [Planctomycetia bacterium]|nr:histidinol dehydrogenase [Planctomycetia bacterium]